jgi:hypothetical protein
LEVFRQGFTSPQYQYFLGFLWGLVAIPGKKTLTRLSSGNPWIRQHVSGWSRFLGCAQWDLTSVQRGLWRMLLDVLGKRLFFKGYLVAAFDTSLIPVSSRKLLGVQRWHDHSGIIELYAARFPIETAIQFMKGEMGMLDCQCSTPIAIHRFMNLVCIATTWWRAMAMTIPLKTWSKHFVPKPYVVHTNTSLAMIRQVLRHWAVRQLIFSKSAKINDLGKLSTMCNDIYKLAA